MNDYELFAAVLMEMNKGGGMSFTRGPWEVLPALNYVGYSIAPRGTLPTLAAVERPAGNNNTISIKAFNFPGQAEANANLIAAAGTAATRAEEMGYDGRAAVEALPEILEALELIASDYDFCKESPGYGDRGSAYAETAREALTRAKGGKHDQR